MIFEHASVFRTRLHKKGRASLKALPIQPPYQRIKFLLPIYSKLCRLPCPQILQEACDSRPATHLLMK